MLRPSEVIAALPQEEVRELKTSYRAKLAQSLNLARTYRGSEPEYDRLFNTLIELENWLAQNFSSQDEKRLSTQHENEVLGAFHNPQLDRTIGDLLALTASKFDGWLGRTSSKNGTSGLLQNLNITHLKMKGALLPPADLPVIQGDGNGDWEKGRMMPRLEELISFLNRHNIYTDDLIICAGDLYAGQMRDLTYYLVEIPRINCQILVCNQVGEATFVIDGIFCRESLLAMSKEDLQRKYPEQVTRIVYKNRAGWEQKLEEALFSEEKPRPTRQLNRNKIDVKKYDAVRDEIRSAYSPEEWVKMNPLQKRELVFADSLKYRAIQSIFGIPQVNSFANYYHLELGAAIFGEDAPAIAKVLTAARVNRATELELGEDAQKWKAQIRKAYTYETWISMTPKQRAEFEFYGQTIYGLAKIAGLTDSTYNDNRTIFLELAHTFFSEDLNTEQLEDLQTKITSIKATEKKKINYRKDLQLRKKVDQPGLQELIGDKIRKDFSLKDWLAMDTKAKRDLLIEGLAYTAIAAVYGINTEKVFRNDSHIELAAAIFGEDQPEIAAILPEIRKNREKEEELGEDPQKWKAEIKKHCSFEKMMDLSYPEREKFSLYGKSLHIIAKIFKLKKLHPIASKKDFIELILYIFQDELDADQIQKFRDDAAQLGEKEKSGKELGIHLRYQPKAEDVDEGRKTWAARIRAEISAKEWVALKPEEIQSKKIHGHGFTPIAKFFGIIDAEAKWLSRKIWLELGGMVFGNADSHIMEALKAIDPETLIAYLRGKYTIEEWVAMGVQKKRAILIGGNRISGIGNILGVKGDAVSYHEIHLKIGAKIFKKEEAEKHITPLLNEFMKQEELGREASKWRQEIRGIYTCEQWSAIKGPDRRKVFIYGRGVSFFGKIFGIEGNVLGNNEAYLELTNKIFAETEQEKE